MVYSDDTWLPLFHSAVGFAEPNRRAISYICFGVWVVIFFMILW
jgi:hypothetical protein